MTKQEAIALAEAKHWEGMSFKEIVQFQLYEDLLTMPFTVFHEAMEAVLDRPIWTHEFAYRDELIEEFESGEPNSSPLEKIQRTHTLA